MCTVCERCLLILSLLVRKKKLVEEWRNREELIDFLTRGMARSSFSSFSFVCVGICVGVLVGFCVGWQLVAPAIEVKPGEHGRQVRAPEPFGSGANVFAGQVSQVSSLTRRSPPAQKVQFARRDPSVYSNISPD